MTARQLSLTLAKNIHTRHIDKKRSICYSTLIIDGTDGTIRSLLCQSSGKEEKWLMFQIDLKCRKPIYEQVIEQYKELIMAGVLKPEEKIPSVRDLAKQLTINPNTIQKAYRELESQGYIYTVSGLGSFISAPSQGAIDRQKIEELKETVRRCLKELLYLNCPRKEIMDIVRELQLSEKEGDQK